MAGQESNEGNEDARFFSRFLEEDRRRCEDECQTRTQPDSGDDDHLGNTQMLSNAGMISEIYSFLQTIEYVMQRKFCMMLMLLLLEDQNKNGQFYLLLYYSLELNRSFHCFVGQSRALRR